MKQIKVHTDRPYDVHIGAGLLAECGEIIRAAAGGSKAAIVSDDNVAPFYLEQVQFSLECAGYECTSRILPAGEEHKNFAELIGIVEAAAEAGLSRKDVLVALGGGVVGDITGFAASIYLRGVSYVQIPTTVLAAVDSSVGGKTAVDLPQGKNLAGAFYQPRAVICDTECFATLPDRVRNSGFAEIIKYAMISDASILDKLELQNQRATEALIARCVEIKAEIVEADERESGVRQLLNFGHTIGHAIEQASEYEMLHGEAVARGMMLACEISESLGRLEPRTKECLEKALKSYNLPAEAKGDYDIESISKYIRSDKKAEGDDVNFILPESVGHCVIERMKIEDLVGAIDEVQDN